MFSVGKRYYLFFWKKWLPSRARSLKTYAIFWAWTMNLNFQTRRFSINRVPRSVLVSKVLLQSNMLTNFFRAFVPYSVGVFVLNIIKKINYAEADRLGWRGRLMLKSKYEADVKEVADMIGRIPPWKDFY